MEIWGNSGENLGKTRHEKEAESMLYKNPRRKKEKEGEYLVYTKLQKAIVHRILDSKTYLSLETNVEIDGLVRNGTTYTTDILAETKDCFYAIECVERKALSRPITMELLALSYSLWDGTKRNGKNVKWEIVTDEG